MSNNYQLAQGEQNVVSAVLYAEPFDPEPEKSETEQEPDFKSELEASVPEAFMVKDEDSANWVIRKITEARDRVARMRDSKKRADVEIKQQKQKEEFFIERYGDQLAQFATSQLDGKKKSVKLLEGVLGFRSSSSKARLECISEASAVHWAKQNLPDAVIVEERINLAVVMEHFKTTGEEIPGVVFVPEESKVDFYVK